MNSKIVNGYKWSFLNVIIKSVAQLGYTAVISRLLDAKAFGIIAMATLIINFGGYFAKLGLGPAIIQKQEVSDDEKNAAFTSSIILGAIATIVIFFIAPAVAIFFNEKELVNIVRVLSLSFIINALSIAPMALLSRNIRFKEIAVIEILAYVVGNIVIGIGCALIGMDEWGLVFATLSQQFIISVASLYILKYKFRLTFNKNSYKSIYSYGTKSTVNNILDYFIVNTDKIFIGRMNSVFLGEYNRTMSVVVMPFEQITVSLSRVFFPQISKLQHDKTELKIMYKKCYLIFGTILTSIGLGAIAASSNIIKVVLGSKWSGIEDIFIVVVSSSIFYYLTHFNAVLCDALARLKLKMKIQIFNLVLILSLSLLVQKSGAFSVLLVMLFAKIINFLIYSNNSRKLLDYKIKEYILMLMYIIRSSVVVFIIIYAIGYALKYYGINIFISLLLQILGGAIGLIIGLIMLPGKDIMEYIKNSKLKYKRGK